jgi:hypothetical protein
VPDSGAPAAADVRGVRPSGWSGSLSGPEKAGGAPRIGIRKGRGRAAEERAQYHLCQGVHAEPQPGSGRRARGVIPSLYDEDKQKFGKVETIADLCDIVKELEGQGSLPPASGVPALFLPFGQQLRGDAAETIGWHIPDINVNCQDHVGKLKTTRVLLIDSSPDVKSCSKVLLHEVGHAVGNGDLTESQMIMGPCDPSSPQQPPIGCQADSTHNLMTAREVKKFCAGAS